jgi:hypothetical protein
MGTNAIIADLKTQCVQDRIWIGNLPKIDVKVTAFNGARLFEDATIDTILAATETYGNNSATTPWLLTRLDMTSAVAENVAAGQPPKRRKYGGEQRIAATLGTVGTAGGGQSARTNVKNVISSHASRQSNREVDPAAQGSAGLPPESVTMHQLDFGRSIAATAALGQYSECVLCEEFVDEERAAEVCRQCGCPTKCIKVSPVAFTIPYVFSSIVLNAGAFAGVRWRIAVLRVLPKRTAGSDTALHRLACLGRHPNI